MRLAVRMFVPVLLTTGAIAGTFTAPAGAAARASWTVMVYMSGDNNLEDFISKDIDTELAPTGSSAAVQVLALADRGPGFDKSHGDWQTTKLFHVSQGMRATPGAAVADWGERDMGDPQTLVDFVRWSEAHYPADHYALYFWGHGWSWHPGVVMKDDTSNDALDYTEMRSVMGALGFIDVVGYDGCNMASIEIQGLWHGHATALAASQEWVGWEGIQYDVVLAKLHADPSMPPDQVAVATARSASSERTFSAVAVDGRWTPLRTAVDRFAVALRTHMAANRSALRKAFRWTQDMWQAPVDKDLYDMARRVRALVPNHSIDARAADVMAAERGATLYDRNVKQYADAHGTTIFFIAKASQKTIAWINWPYYRRTDLARTTRWDAFLRAWAS